jgi:predicted nucleic acid-binding protein
VRQLFADAFYWVALLHRRDAAHRRALAFGQKLAGSQLVTTDEVLTEVLAFTSNSGPRGRRVAADSIRNILVDPNVRVLPQSREGFVAGLGLYEKRLDKGYSLTDCISMNTMRNLDIDAVITNDRHFAQEGFRILPGPEG